MEIIEGLRGGGHRLIFIDETSINLDLARRFGWGPQGQRVKGSVPRNTPPAHSFIGALAPEGLIATMDIEGAVNNEAFCGFTGRFLVPHLAKGDVVILDNHSTHFCPKAIETIEATGAWVLYLPDYSPDFNPIELCWSKFKQLLRTAAARTHTALHRAMQKAITAITPSDVQGWFEHLGYWVPSA